MVDLIFKQLTVGNREIKSKINGIFLIHCVQDHHGENVLLSCASGKLKDSIRVQSILHIHVKSQTLKTIIK